MKKNLQNTPQNHFKNWSPVLRIFASLLITLTLASCNLEPEQSAGSSNAQLSGIVLSNGTLLPDFSPDSPIYTTSVPNIVDRIIISPTAVDQSAVITINDSFSPGTPLGLFVGQNIFEIKVSASDGITIRTYKITVTRALPLPSNANLSSIAISGAVLKPTFTPSITNYTATLGFLSTSGIITPEVVASGAQVSVNGTIVTSPLLIPFEEGKNTIEVVVTAPDTITTKTYTIILTRQTAGTFAETSYLKASNPGENDRFGSTVALFGNTLAVGSPGEDSNATGINGNDANNAAPNSGAVYIFTRTTDHWEQSAYIKASNTAAENGFGRSIALSEDTLAVAAPLEDSVASDSGAVYVFTRTTGGTWNQQAILKASNPDSNDHFGTSIALSGDRLAVGARFEDSNGRGINTETENNNGAEDGGAVYVFLRTGNVWQQEAYLKASNTDPFDAFGSSLSLAGDFLAVGARFEDGASISVNGDGDSNSSRDSGAVYVFHWSEVESTGVFKWKQEAYIKAPDNHSTDGFGWSVSLSETTLAVGTPGEDSSSRGVNGLMVDDRAPNSGAVYIFIRNTEKTWQSQAYLKAPNTDEKDAFGQSVSLSRNLLAVSAPSERSEASGINGVLNNNESPGSGAVYLYERIEESWYPQSYIKASNTEAFDAFGIGLALSENTLVVGAPLEDSVTSGDPTDKNAIDSGAVYTNTFLFPAQNNSKTTLSDESSNTRFTMNKTSNSAGLADLSLSKISLIPAFDSETTSYTANAGFITKQITLHAISADTEANISVNGLLASSVVMDLQEGLNVINIVVTAPDGKAAQTYQVEIMR